MYETYFTLNPDGSSPMGLLEVPVTGEESAHHNTEHADLIRRAIDASGVQDPQAQVMEAFYRGEGIPAELMWQVEPTIQELDVAWPLRGHLYKMLDVDPDSAPFTEQEVEALGNVCEAEGRGYIIFLTAGGLVIDNEGGRFAGPLLQDATEPLDVGEDAYAIATRLGTRVYGFQAELVWQSGDGDTVRPVLRSDRQHIALGSLAADGTFEYAVTVLDSSHPARQPVGSQ